MKVHERNVAKPHTAGLLLYARVDKNEMWPTPCQDKCAGRI